MQHPPAGASYAYLCSILLHITGCAVPFCGDSQRRHKARHALRRGGDPQWILVSSFCPRKRERTAIQTISPAGPEVRLRKTIAALWLRRTGHAQIDLRLSASMVCASYRRCACLPLRINIPRRNPSPCASYHVQSLDLAKGCFFIPGARGWFIMLSGVHTYTSFLGIEGRHGAAVRRCLCIRRKSARLRM